MRRRDYRAPSENHRNNFYNWPLLNRLMEFFFVSFVPLWLKLFLKPQSETTIAFRLDLGAKNVILKGAAAAIRPFPKFFQSSCAVGRSKP
jgi:hypothetical protein